VTSGSASLRRSAAPLRSDKRLLHPVSPLARQGRDPGEAGNLKLKEVVLDDGVVRDLLA